MQTIKMRIRRLMLCGMQIIFGRILKGFFALCLAAGIFVIFAYNYSDTDKPTCSLDGSLIQPVYEVIFVQKDKFHKRFSCILSAQIRFRKNSEQVAHILVTDEITGKKIKANQAFYVASDIITTHYTGNKTHAFAEKSAAESHARKHNGKFVVNPFKAYEKKPVITVKYKTDSQKNSDFVYPSSHEPLATNYCSILTIRQDDFIAIQTYSNRFADGFLNLPYKPPRNIS